MNSITKKVLFILTERDRLKVLFLLIISFLRSILDLLSVGLIVPFLIFLFNEDKKVLILNYIPYLKQFSQNELIVLSIIVLLIIYLFKTLTVILVNFLNERVAQNLRVEISKKLLSKYLNNNFLFFVENNSSKLLRNISSETMMFTNGIVVNFINFFNNTIFFIGICAGLIIYDINSIYIMGVLLLISSIIIFAYNKKFYEWGTIRSIESENFIRELNEVFGSIKEVILYNKANYYLEETLTPLRKFAKSTIYKDSFSQTTAPLIEFVGVSIFFLFLIFLILFVKMEINSVFVLVGFLAFASIKILPNLVALIKSIQSFKYNIPAVENIYKDFTSRKNRKSNKILNDIKNIKFSNVSFTYPETKKSVLKNVNFSINKGDKVAIVGETGSGKSTLLNLLSGLLLPTRGNIYSSKFNLKNYQLNIGYVSQFVYMSDKSIIRNVSLSKELSIKNKKRINEILKNLSLDRLTRIKKNKKTGERGAKISGGQIQRIGIARAIYRNPSILVLDEATNSLDVDIEKKVLKYVFSNFKDKIIIFCTHKQKLIKYCNKVVEVKNNSVKIKKT